MIAKLDYRVLRYPLSRTSKLASSVILRIVFSHRPPRQARTAKEHEVHTIQRLVFPKLGATDCTKLKKSSRTKSKFLSKDSIVSVDSGYLIFQFILVISYENSSYVFELT